VALSYDDSTINIVVVVVVAVIIIIIIIIIIIMVLILEACSLNKSDLCSTDNAFNIFFHEII